MLFIYNFICRLKYTDFSRCEMNKESLQQYQRLKGKCHFFKLYFHKNVKLKYKNSIKKLPCKCHA